MTVQKKGMHGCLIAFITLICIAGGFFVIFIIAGIAGAFDGGAEVAASSPSPTISPDQFKASCLTVDYKELARRPDENKDKSIKFTGQIVEISGRGAVRMRIAEMEPGDAYPDYDRIMWVAYDMPDGAPRFLEDDLVTAYGTSKGMKSYIAVLGNEISIPAMNAEYIDLISEE